MKGAIAGVEMVSLPLQFPNSAHVLICMWFACAVQEEPMKGCGDGSWKETQCFQCQPGREFFCPLTAIRPDGRLQLLSASLRGDDTHSANASEAVES